MDEEVIECTYNPPGPKVGEYVEIVKLVPVEFIRSIPDRPLVGMVGKIRRRLRNADTGAVRYRVDFDDGDYVIDFAKTEFKKK